jgi:ribosomal protein S27E
MNDQPTPRFVSCRCQHCDAHIEFDASKYQEGDTATVKCPDCQMDTEIFIPQSTPPPPAKTVTPKPDAKPSKTTSETIPTRNFWMQAFSIILFLCGALSICMGALVWFGLLTSKEGTVFQEYEGIFFSLGGLIIIALSLILWAILSLKK